MVLTLLSVFGFTRIEYTEKQRKIIEVAHHRSFTVVNDGKLAGMKWCQSRIHAERRQVPIEPNFFSLHMDCFMACENNTQMNHSCDCWHCFISWWLPALFMWTVMVDVLNQIMPRMPFRFAFASALDDSFRSVSPWDHETSNITEMWYTVDVRPNWF